MQKLITRDFGILELIFKPFMSAYDKKNNAAVKTLDSEISRLQDIKAAAFSKLRVLVREYQNVLENKESFKMTIDSFAKDPKEEIRELINEQVDILYSGKYDIESIRCNIQEKWWKIECSYLDLFNVENSKNLLLTGTVKYKKYPDFYKTVQDERDELDNIYFNIIKDKVDFQGEIEVQK